MLFNVGLRDRPFEKRNRKVSALFVFTTQSHTVMTLKSLCTDFTTQSHNVLTLQMLPGGCHDYSVISPSRAALPHCVRGKKKK